MSEPEEVRVQEREPKRTALEGQHFEATGQHQSAHALDVRVLAEM